MKRRPNGHSSIFKGADGRWHGWVTMTLGRSAETRVRKHVSGKTREIVLAKVCDLEGERTEEAGPPRPGEAIETVQDWIGYWLLNVAERRTKTQTARRYRSILQRHVLPRLGRIRLRDLHEHHLDRMYGSMLGEGAAPATLKEVRRVLSTVLNEALHRELVTRNVAKRAAIPRAISPEIQPLTVEEAQRVFATAVSEPNGVAWIVAIALGLRRSEVLALRWEDIDLDAGTLSVHRTIERLPWAHGCPDVVECCFDQHDERCLPDCIGHAELCPHRQGGLAFSTPKSQAGYRTLVLPPSLRGALEAHRHVAGQQSSKKHRGLVFRDARGQAIDPNAHSLQWKAVLKRAGVRAVRLHDARHSAATFLLMQGVDARTTMALMGWSHIELTERYQHVVTPLRTDAAERLEALLWPSPIS